MSHNKSKSQLKQSVTTPKLPDIPKASNRADSQQVHLPTRKIIPLHNHH